MRALCLWTQGEGFIRISSFGHREDVLEAVARLVKVLKK